MKRYRIFVPLMLFAALPWLLGSCCYSDNGSLNSNQGLRIRMEDKYDYSSYYYDYIDYTIEKVEFIGTNKVVRFNGYDGDNKPIVLNPKDTLCNLRIYYYTSTNTDSICTGTVTISYSGKPEYKNDGCDNSELVITYDAKVTATTFKSATIRSSYYDYYDEPTLEISN